jgi:hypothetical protein
VGSIAKPAFNARRAATVHCGRGIFRSKLRVNPAVFAGFGTYSMSFSAVKAALHPHEIAIMHRVKSGRLISGPVLP